MEAQNILRSKPFGSFEQQKRPEPSVSEIFQSNMLLQGYDERRLQEGRYLVAFQTAAYICLQIPNTLHPREDTFQAEVQAVYWVVTLVQLSLLAASFVNIKSVIPSIIIMFFRLLSPMFNFEGLPVEEESAWLFLVANQGGLCLFTIVLCLNCFHQHEILLGGVLLTSLYLALIDATWGLNEFFIEGKLADLPSCLLAIVGSLGYLYVLKRTHKDVFFEIQVKSEQQAEFKTIFDEYDSAVCVIKGGQLTKMNSSFKDFVKNYIGRQELDEICTRETTAQSAGQSGWFQGLRWNNKQQAAPEDQRLGLKNFEANVFIPHYTKQAIGVTPLSLLDLAEENSQYQVFRVEPLLQEFAQKFVEVRRKQYWINEEAHLMLSIVDVSLNISYQQASGEKEHLSLINATVSHELRNPLQSILAQNLKAVSLLSELRSSQPKVIRADQALQLPQLAELEQSLLVNESCTKQMELILDNMLDFQQINSGKFIKTTSEFELEQAIDEIRKIHAPKAKLQGIEIRSETHGGSVTADKRRFQQVLNNLLKNALKFSTSGGSVVITSSSVKSKDSCCYLETRVKDSGLGMSADDQARLFCLFGFVASTSEDNTKGIGVGLTVSKLICEQYEGSIEVESRLGEGSIFTFRMKLEDTEESQQPYLFNSRTLTTMALSNESQSQKSLLIVEDDPFNVEALKVLISSADSRQFRIEVACNGQEAVEKCKDERFSLIFMDCNMPVMDGYTATELIKARARELSEPEPIIVSVTAHREEKFLSRCLTSGSDMIIPKPAKMEKIKEALALLG